MSDLHFLQINIVLGALLLLFCFLWVRSERKDKKKRKDRELVKRAAQIANSQDRIRKFYGEY